MIKWLLASATQGSADAFKEVEIPTGLINLGTQAYRIRRIEWNAPTMIATATNNWEASITRKSFSSAPGVNQNALINRVSVGRTFGSAVGNIDQQFAGPAMTFTYDRDEELVIVEDPLYLQLDSAGTSAANSVQVRIGYEVRSISTVERLALIAASLS